MSTYNLGQCRNSGQDTHNTKTKRGMRETHEGDPSLTWRTRLAPSSSTSRQTVFTFQKTLKATDEEIRPQSDDSGGFGFFSPQNTGNGAIDDLRN